MEKKIFFNFVNLFSLFRNYIYLPLEKGEALHLNKLESPSPKDALCKVWSKLTLWFWRRRFFNFVNVFSLFRNYLPLEDGRALHLNKTESPLPKDALFQIKLKLALDKKNLNFVINCLCLPFCYSLPLEKDVVLQLN